MELRSAEIKLSEALKRQEELRSEQAELKIEIKTLKGIIRRHRLVKPHLSYEAITKRNKEIFISWVDGTSFAELSMKYHISAERVRDICNWIEHALSRGEGVNYERYESLKNIKPKNSLLTKKESVSITREQQILRY